MKILFLALIAVSIGLSAPTILSTKDKLKAYLKISDEDFQGCKDYKTLEHELSNGIDELDAEFGAIMSDGENRYKENDKLYLPYVKDVCHKFKPVKDSIEKVVNIALSCVPREKLSERLALAKDTFCNIFAPLKIAHPSTKEQLEGFFDITEKDISNCQGDFRTLEKKLANGFNKMDAEIRAINEEGKRKHKTLDAAAFLDISNTCIDSEPLRKAKTDIIKTALSSCATKEVVSEKLNISKYLTC